MGVGAAVRIYLGIFRWTPISLWAEVLWHIYLRAQWEHPIVCSKKRGLSNGPKDSPDELVRLAQEAEGSSSLK